METKLIRRKVLGVVAAVALAGVGLGVLPVPHAAADPSLPPHTPSTPPVSGTPADTHKVRICHYVGRKLLYCETQADPIVEPAPNSSALV